MAVIRVYVEKREPYNVEAAETLGELRELLGVSSLTALRLLNRYDV